MRPLAVFNAGPFGRSKLDGLLDYCGGDNGVLFARCLGLDVADVLEIDVQQERDLPRAGELSGVVVSGSASMVTDREPWSEHAARWLADNDGKLPVLGVCFGHQLLAHALGGVVDQNPAGSEYGTVGIDTLAAARADPLFARLPARFTAQAAHSQRVARLPNGAIPLAENAFGNQGARMSANSWGVQFHPEFDAGLMGLIMTSFRDYCVGLGLDVDRVVAGLEDTPVALRVLGNFMSIVRGASAAAAAE